MSLPARIALLVLFVMVSCHLSLANPKLNNAMLWKRLGLNRAIGGDRPQITTNKKKGESTVYFIKLPPQPHYYIPLNAIPSGQNYEGRRKSTPDPFQTVDVDFTANGKPNHVYHWNLPLNITIPMTTSTSTTPTYEPPTPTTVAPEPTTAPEISKKPVWQQRFLNNGKPQKLYFVKPFYKSNDENPGSFKKHYKKTYYMDNDKANHVYRVQSANDY